MYKPVLLQKTSLQQTLTPQQIHYLKLLQLPVLQLEQSIQQELEENPFLEEIKEEDLSEFAEHDIFAPAPDQQDPIPTDFIETNSNSIKIENGFSLESQTTEVNNYQLEYERNDVFTDELKTITPEEGDSYEHYDERWEDDADFTPNKTNDYEQDFEPFQIKSESSLYEDLLFQQRLLDLTPEENIISLHIIGNIDEDGYLRRDLAEIVNEVNSSIASHNFHIQQEQYKKNIGDVSRQDTGNAKYYALEAQSIDVLKSAIKLAPEVKAELIKNQSRLDKYTADSEDLIILRHVTLEVAENVLKKIQTLDPPGIASRNIQECLLAQLNSKHPKNFSQELAIKILSENFEAFSKKHFALLQKSMNISEEEIRDAFEEIKRLNPKPGGYDFKSEINTIIPDFIVRFDEDINDLIININDTTIPNIKVSSTYEKIRQEARNNKLYNKETKEWIRGKYENARFFIQAIRQRNITMLMVMTAIAERQRDFFVNSDKNKIKPMVYKDIADDTALDISTVCRIVNNKYAATPLGTFELKYFFSEALPNDDGEEVSTTVIKDKIRDIVASESKKKPLSDDKIALLLKEEGLNVARRTIAKYRETLKIPVARLRKEL